MRLEGNWYANGSAAKYSAVLTTQNSLYEIQVENEKLFSGSLESLCIESRLGNIERKITLHDGSIFTTYDNDTLDMLYAQKKNKNKSLHYLESKIHWVVLALVITIFSIFASFKWGIPLASKGIAHALPTSTNKIISIHTMDILDKYIFKESKISKIKMEQIRTNFKRRILPTIANNEEYKYKLHFRLFKDANLSLPNAMALPSGDIILTDKFVQLCQSQDEIDSILLHEIGHVVHRHSLVTLIQSTFISVGAMVILGDSNGLADMGVGLGSMMINLQYSREYETQADTYAFEHMLHNNIDPVAFSNIMDAMSIYLGNGDKEDSSGYISTHPKTILRTKRAKLYSECFKQGNLECADAKSVY